MTIDLAQLKQDALAATPGPWEAQPYGGFYPSMYTPQIKAADGTVVFSPSCDVGTMRSPEIVPGKSASEADGRFIAAANPAVVLELVRQLAATHALLEQVLPYINPKAIDPELVRSEPIGDAYINTLVARFLKGGA